MQLLPAQPVKGQPGDQLCICSGRCFLSGCHLYKSAASFMTNCGHGRWLVVKTHEADYEMHACYRCYKPVSQCKQYLLWLKRACIQPMALQAVKFKHWHNNMRSRVLSWLTSSSSSSSANDSFDFDESLARFACFSSLTWVLDNQQESATALSQY